MSEPVSTPSPANRIRTGFRRLIQIALGFAAICAALGILISVFAKPSNDGGLVIGLAALGAIVAGALKLIAWVLLGFIEGERPAAPKPSTQSQPPIHWDNLFQLAFAAAAAGVAYWIVSTIGRDAFLWLRAVLSD